MILQPVRFSAGDVGTDLGRDPGASDTFTGLNEIPVQDILRKRLLVRGHLDGSAFHRRIPFSF
jgi:hypothetical protein